MHNPCLKMAVLFSKVTILLLIGLILTASAECGSSSSDLQKLDLDGDLKELYDRVISYQALKQTNYTPPFDWARKVGLFESDIRIMISGGPVETEFRSSFEIYDNDMFSTGWIVTALLDAVLYGRQAPVLDNTRLNLALVAINDFKDRNVPNIDNLPIKTFWPQIFNETLNIWQSQPDNIRELCLNFDKLPWQTIQKLLRLIKLDVFADDIGLFKSFIDMSLKAFQIPPDFDDTYLNMGLGATLKKLGSVYPGAYENWSKHNQNMEVLVNYTIKYAYNPFDSDPNKSLIDPRTYFFARPFLLEAQENNQSVSLITTWIQNIDEQKELASKGVSMPFNLNNVDVTVCANSIYGIASAVLFDVNSFRSLFLQSPQMQQVFLNTTRFISWAIKTNYTKRPDLAQVYYPSTYNFLWYASRTLFLLTNELLPSQNRYADPLKSILAEAQAYLQDTFENYVTAELKQKAKYGGDQSELYYDDFLGLNDTNLFGKQTPSGEDRIFSTSQAVNILIATWTYQHPTSKQLVWKPNTPAYAKYLLDSSAKWLRKNVFDRKLKPLNAFFSGSVKGFLSLPFWYPANYFKFLNGTFVDPSRVQQKDFGNMYIGVNGLIDEQTYSELLSTPHFGIQTPIEFPGYNVKNNFFPFWSSNAYTYSVAFLALSQYNNIQAF
jgi:hypothetical protein